MRIHANTLAPHQIYEATCAAGMTGVDVTLTDHGSRSRARAYDVKLTGTSSRRPNGSNRDGESTDNYAATWDEWGMFLAALFAADDSLTIPHVYADVDDFHFKTGGRYHDLTADEQHKHHRWEYAGTAVTGAYMVHNCKTCDATRRFTLR